MIRTDVAFEGWPSGVDRVILTAPVDLPAFADKYDVKLLLDADDLGDFAVIFFYIDGIGPVCIEKYTVNPPTVNPSNLAIFRVDVGVNEKEASELLIKAFDLDRSTAQLIEYEWELQDDKTWKLKED